MGSSVALSKKLSYLLRHGAAEAGLAMQPDGFVLLSELLALPQMRRATTAEVREVVATNDKQRFMLRDDPDGAVWIRANQGHTLRALDDEALLVEVTDPAELPVCVHGTQRRHIGAIRRQGLSRMARNHVHFAAGLPGAGGVISGMRSTSEVLIYLDVPAAMSAGLRLYRSANGVILTPGDADGLIAPGLFAKLVEREASGGGGGGGRANLEGHHSLPSPLSAPPPLDANTALEAE